MFLNLKFSLIPVLHCATHRSWALITNIDRTLLFLFIPSCFYLLPITRPSCIPTSSHFPSFAFQFPSLPRCCTMRGDRLFTFPSFEFQPFKLLMKVQSKVFQVQLLGGLRMDLPLSIVLFHILAIKIRYRSCSCGLLVYLFVPSATYHQSIYVGFPCSHRCFFLSQYIGYICGYWIPTSQEARCGCWK